MNKNTVGIAATAKADALAAFKYIHARSPLNAARWLRGLDATIAKLEDFAGHGRAPETESLGRDIRQIVYKSHRILYTTDQNAKTVTVLYVRHGARRAIGEPPGS